LGARTAGDIQRSISTLASQGVPRVDPDTPVPAPGSSAAHVRRPPLPGGVAAAEARTRQVTRQVRARAAVEKAARQLDRFEGHEWGGLKPAMKRALRRAQLTYDRALFRYARVVDFDLQSAVRQALGGPCAVLISRLRPAGGTTRVMAMLPLGGFLQVPHLEYSVLRRVLSLTTFGEWERLREPRLGLERAASGRRPLEQSDLTLWWLAGAALSCGINRSALYRVLKAAGVFTQSRQALEKRFRVLEAAGLTIAPRPHPSTRQRDLAAPPTPSKPPTAAGLRQAAINREATAQRRMRLAVERRHDSAFVDSLAERERRYGEECAARLYAAVAAAGAPP
jgi:hypothetical protein